MKNICDYLNMLTENNEHIIFIVGRGRTDVDGNMNFPENKGICETKHVVYVDQSHASHPDINARIQDVNFNTFGITRKYDPNKEINVIFLFDWSTIYCNALPCFPAIGKKLGRKFFIFVPLDKNDDDIPSEYFRELNDAFQISIINGKYPLFDWSKTNSCQREIRDFINPDKYILITAGGSVNNVKREF